MKRKLLTLTAAMTVMGAMATGVYAQSTPEPAKPMSSSPSTTPNDGTGVPPNTPVPAGQIPPVGDKNSMQHNQGTMNNQHTGAPGSKTGMPQGQNQVPTRQAPGTTAPGAPSNPPNVPSNTGGK